MTPKNTICLWFDKDAQEAARFYAAIFPRGQDGEIVGLDSGIRFTVSGNFYGNNRVAATVPFNLGTATQTDWGGNVGF